jgi:hemerythrin-like domain-containing protein
MALRFSAFFSFQRSFILRFVTVNAPTPRRHFLTTTLWCNRSTAFRRFNKSSNQNVTTEAQRPQRLYASSSDDVLKSTGSKYLMPLIQEHRVINRILVALQGYINVFEKGDSGALQPELASFVILLIEFVQQKHQGKEKEILFPFLIQNNFPLASGVMKELEAEHVRMQELVTTLTTCSQVQGLWNDVQRTILLRDTKAYISLMISHISKEENEFFLQIYENIPQSLLLNVEKQLEEIEHQYLKTGATPRLIRLAATLDRKYAGHATPPPPTLSRKVAHEP